MLKSKPTLSSKLLDALQMGWDRMHPEAQQLVMRFVKSQSDEHGGFKNRNGKQDLYYTFFGLLLSSLQGKHSGREKTITYLNQINPHDLDAIHLGCWIRSKMLCQYLSLPQRLQKQTFLHRFRKIEKSDIAVFERLTQRNEPLLFPNHDSKSPYAKFIEVGTQQDLKLSVSPLDFAVYTTPSGGMSNLKNQTTPSLNAMSATLALSSFCTVSQLNISQLITQILELQNSDGSFKGHPALIDGDLLSTATAHWALRLHNITPRYDVRPFLKNCFAENGGFHAGTRDLVCDLEYTFYGILTMGSC